MGHCATCGAELRDGAKYCGECGMGVCPSCGESLVEGARFCGECGTPLAVTVRVREEVASNDEDGAYGPAAAPSSPGEGVAGFVLVLIGLFVPLLGLIGLILSWVGYARARREGLATGLSLAGVIIGMVATVLGVIVFLLLVGVIAVSGSAT